VEPLTQQDANNKNYRCLSGKKHKQIPEYKTQTFELQRVHFNRTCIDFKLVSKYAKTKIKSHDKAISQHQTDKIQVIRIKNEIKCWYKKNNF
jgi:hypothetical protein